MSPHALNNIVDPLLLLTALPAFSGHDAQHNIFLFHRLSIVGHKHVLHPQQFGRNFECKVAACSYHPCAPNFRTVVLASVVVFDIAASP